VLRFERTIGVGSEKKLGESNTITPKRWAGTELATANRNHYAFAKAQAARVAQMLETVLAQDSR